ncbi:MAG: SAM domain-containing protein, partial [Gammaproteobacteria bacterium]
MSARISEWLQDLGLGQYADRFEANDIDWDLLADIDHQALKDIGIESVGHRIRILKAIGNSDRPAAEKAPSAAAPA